MREIELRPRKRVLFQNREWAVTTRVVECIGDGKPDYRFRLERADEGIGGKFGLIWPPCTWPKSSGVILMLSSKPGCLRSSVAA